MLENTRYQVPVLVVGLAVALAALGIMTAGETSTAPERPLPFDPLSAAEQSEAIALAEADPIVTLQLNRYVTIGASLRTVKMPDISLMPRLADVQFYDYTTDQPVWAVVDLGTDQVKLEPVLEAYQPALTGPEMDRADELARAHEGVLGRLPNGEHPSASHLWNGPGTQCPVHRCVITGFFVDDHPYFTFFVLVDLSADTVLEIIENPWFVPFEEGSS